LTAVIVGFARTPIGKFGGIFKDISAPDLASIAIKAALNRSGVSPEEVDEVIMGNVIQAGIGMNPARQAAVKAGIPWRVPGFTISKVCASGLRAVSLAASIIKLGEAKVIVAGGMESMSNAPYMLSSKWRWGVKFSYAGEKVVDLMVYDGLTDPHTGMFMGEEAELTAKKFGITREEADRFAVRSHKLASEATEKGYFRDEIVEVEVDGVKYDKDEGIRPDTSIEKISKLKPVFRPDGIITAANASQLSDGAAALVVVDEEFAKERGLKPIARIIGYSSAAVDSKDFIEAPIPSVKDLLGKLGMKISDFDLFEHNEAFSLATLAVIKALEIPEDKINVFGGAVALGHPLGASGARILVTLLNALKKRGGKRGIATICHGGGGAHSIAVELV
jgi:acetyl-CoA C-acetyltransferase